jgi:hypothetical protein
MMDVFHILYSLIKPPACIKKWTFLGTSKNSILRFLIPHTKRKLSSIEHIIVNVKRAYREDDL